MQTVKHLVKELENSIEGEVRFEPGSRALYSTDSSHYRQIPIGVVLPKNKEDVIRTVSLCRKYGFPLLSRGAGTSLAGQGCNAAVVMDMSKYFNRIVKIDPLNRFAVVEPGVVYDQLAKAAAPYGLMFGPDPSTHHSCTFGGMIGNNSCGIHSLMAGKTDDNVLELEILTYDGLQLRVGPATERSFQEGGIYAKLKNFAEKYSPLIESRYPLIPRRVSGYNLPWLLKKNGFDVAKALVGSESTCVTILEAKVKLIPIPLFRTLLILGYPDLFTACDNIPEILLHSPIGLEGMDYPMIEELKKNHFSSLPGGRGWLFVQFGGETQEEALSKAHRLMNELRSGPFSPEMQLFDNPAMEREWMEAREIGAGTTSKSKDQRDRWGGWEDSAVAPEKLGAYLRDLQKLLNAYGYTCAFYGHFGQGCVHARIDFDLYTQEGIQKYRSFIGEAADIVVRYGGSLSGEHGDGQSRAELLPKMFGEELIEAFREFKRIWDPEGKMNPGKIVDAYKATDNLRVAHFNPKPLFTHFKFPEDRGSFARAALRCIGVGQCRRAEGGTMCPSYMATKEEKHSTRGRARLLFEMLQGESIGKNGWKDEAVKEALDLCLSCKGCKTECPMNVDMASYKAEFLSHYYQGRPRPRCAYAFGYVSTWAKIGAYFPGIANFLARSSLSKWSAGMAQQRKIPPLASFTFKKWFSQRPNTSGQKVLLWPDTFTNYFHPEIAIAATRTLEKMGFQPILPKSSLCCGRPLYDYGMLTRAKKLLKRILIELKEEIQDGIPLIGLEPGCLSVFRDELCNLFPDDHLAKKLNSQAFTLSEFIQKYAPDYCFKPLNKKALVHGHCHHKTLLKFDCEKKILLKLGLETEILDSGCCGMAGGFGFEKEHYEISIEIGERSLFPKIRESDQDVLIIANGFSCREQIKQATGRKAIHLAEILHQSFT